MATRQEVLDACDAFHEALLEAVNDNTTEDISPQDVRTVLEYLNTQIRNIAAAVRHWDC